jgi:uncharacterized membrane protein YeiB
MLIGLIVLGIVLYLILYFAFSSYNSANAISTATGFDRVRDMVFEMPASLPMAILKWTVGIMLLYAVCNMIFSAIKRDKTRRVKARRPQMREV